MQTRKYLSEIEREEMEGRKIEKGNLGIRKNEINIECRIERMKEKGRRVNIEGERLSEIVMEELREEIMYSERY